jgi:hypothetical protein
MRKMPLKALLALLTFNQTEGARPNWDRIVIIASTVVTIGLVALYIHGKTTGRW